MEHNNNNNEIQDAAVSALAAASKTPFKTAFKVTLGIGLARATLFLVVVSGLAAIMLTYNKLAK
jgi:threonine/homoserine/homoserine lactone efflux protein